MNGIPIRIRRDGEQETVYLSTARSGEAGETIRQAKHAAGAAMRAVFATETQISILLQKADRADKNGAPIEDVEKLAAEMTALAESAAAAREAALAACEKLWLACLWPNHGPDSVGILDCLGDAQARAILKIIEIAEEPKDFFPLNAPPPSASSTGPGAGSTSGSSSNTGSPPPTSKADDAGSETPSSSPRTPPPSPTPSKTPKHELTSKGPE